MKVTESGHLLNQNQMINYFFRGFIPLKIFIPEKQEDSQSLWLKEYYVKITEILYVTVLWEVAFHCLAQEKEILTTQATQLGFVLCNKFQIKKVYNKPLNIAPNLKVCILESFRLKRNWLAQLTFKLD